LGEEKRIAEWEDGEGRVCCIHTDKARAEDTIKRIRECVRGGEDGGYEVEVVVAHDVVWEEVNAQRLVVSGCDVM